MVSWTALAIGLALAPVAFGQVTIPAGTNVGAYLNTNLNATNNSFVLGGDAVWNTSVAQTAPRALLTLDGAGYTITTGGITNSFLHPSSSVTPTAVTLSNLRFQGTSSTGYPLFYYNGTNGYTVNLNLNDVTFNNFTGGSGVEGSVMYMNVSSTTSSTVNVTAGGANGITFSNNVGAGDAAGALAMYVGTMNFDGRVAFDSNTTDNYGGAVSMYQGQGVLNFNGPVTFTNNRAANYFGGAIDLWGGDSRLIFNGPTVFSGNYVSSVQTGAGDPRGGAINIGYLSPGSGATIAQFNDTVTFDGNYINSTGGNGNARGGAISAFGNGSSYDYRYVFTAPAIFTNNFAVKSGSGSGGGYGGAIFYDSANATASLASGSQFLNNSASTSGGAIYLQSGTITFNALTDNIRFEGNRQGVSVSGGRPVAGSGEPNAIYLGTSGNLNLNVNAGQQIQFYDPIGSTAGSTVTVTQTGDGEVILHGDNGATALFDSTIRANTTVRGGDFTLADSVNYGTVGAGTFLVTTGSGTAGTVRGGANSNLRAQAVTVADGGTVAVTGGTLTLDATTINFQNGARFGGNGILAATNNMILAGTVIATPDAGNTLNVSGRFTGAGGLSVQGSGRLVLSTPANAYTGTTAVGAGATLMGGVTGAFGLSSGMTVEGTLDLGQNNLNQTVANLAGSGTILLGSATLTDNSTAATTYSGSIAGSGSFIKSGTGNLTLSGAANSYTGGTTIQAGGGTLTATHGNALGTGAVANGATFELDFAADSTFANLLTGTGALQKTGAGKATLTAASSSAGTVTVSAGTLDFAQTGVFTASSLTTGAGATTQIGANAQLSLSGTLAQAAGATLNVDVGAANPPLVTANAATLNGTLNVTGFSGVVPALASALSANAYTIIHTTGGGISGNFTSFNPAGSSSPVDYLTILGQQSGADYNVGFGLAWLGGAGGGNGTFTLVNPGDTFNVDVALGNQVASATGWNGQTLTKNGAGLLVLSADNTYTGPTTINAGTLQLGNGGTTGSILGDVVDNGTLTLNRSNALTLAGAISGTGAVSQIGGGTTTLTGTNTYTGITTIAAGTLQIGDGGATGSIAGDVVNDSALLINRSGTVAFGGAISGTGSVSQIGAGVAALSGTNTYTGGTTIAAGTLQLGAGGATGSIVGDVADNGTLAFNRSDVAVFGGVISGTGAVEQSGAGTTVLTAANTYGGGTTIGAGTLQIGNNNFTGSIVGDVVNNGTLTFARTNFITFDGEISGSGTLSQISGGTTTLTGANTYGGGTTIAAGTLQLGSGGTTGSIVGNVVDNGTLVFNRSDAVSFDGVVSGGGAVAQNGAGTTTLTGANTYTGATTITAGTLQIGNGGTTGSIVGNVVDNGTLAFNRSDTLTLAGSIGGGGSLQQIGTGTTLLTGDSSAFTGTTSVTSGRLLVDGTLGSVASTLSVSSGGTLGGHGTIGGNVSIADGVLSPGASPGTLTIGGNLAFTSASILNYEFGQAGVPGGTLNDLTIVGGNLTLDGTLNVTVPTGGSFGAGVYRVFNYSGTLTDNGLALGTMPAGSATFVQTGFAGQVNLVNTAGVTLNYWDGTGPKFDGVINGGSGIWQAAGGNDNWTDSTGALNAAYTDGAFSVFAGAAGTVTVDTGLGAVTSSGMQFAVNGYVVQGGPITLLAGGNTLRVGDGTGAGAGYVATIASALDGTGGVVKTDLGTLVLTGANGYTGGTTISAGTLQIGNGGTSGSIVGDVVDNGGLAFNRSDTVSFAGTIGGTGSVAQIGTGTTVLTADNTYSGGTTISAGTLQIGDGGTTGSIAGDVADNGTLAFNRSDAVSFGGIVSGSGVVAQNGAGTTTLTGANSYTGGTTITAGTLQLGNGGTTGSIVGNVVDNGTLLFNRSDTLTLAGAISGTGAVNQIGGGTTVLTGTNSYTGGTTIAAGALQLGAGGTTGSIVGDVANSGTLVFDRSDVASFGGLISGTGSVTQAGAGTTVLTAANTYGGGTTITAGTLQLGAGGTSGSIVGSVVDNGTLAFNRSDAVTFGSVISGSGAASQIGAGVTTLTGTNTYTGGTTITAGTLQLGAGGTTGSIVGNVVDNGTLAFNRSDAVAFGGVISGSGAVAQNGTGTTTLTGANSYTGGTTITAGTLQIGNGGTTGSIVGNVVDNGTLVFNRSDALTLAGSIGGGGSLQQIGTGTTLLTGDSSAFTGATAVTNGTLRVNGTLGSPTSTMSVSSGGTIAGHGTIGGSVAIADGVLSPGGSVGTLTIGGNLSLASASVLNYEFGQAGVPGGTLNDLTIVGGNLTLDGTLNVSAAGAGSFGPGLYRVISYGGTLTDNGLVLGTVPAASVDIVQTGFAGQVNLVNTAGLTLNYWDGTGPKFDGVVNGGSGVWQAGAGNDNWTESSGMINAGYSNGAFAVFGGTPGTVTVDNSLGPVTSSGMQFATGGYLVQGGPITLQPGAQVFRVGDGTSAGAGYVAAIDAELTGTGGLIKTDLGTLALTGTNTYTGGTTITTGTLQLGNGGTTGSILGDVVNQGRLVFNRSDTAVFGGEISGSGVVVQAGPGTTVLTADNSYLGGTTIAGGTLQLGNNGATGSILGDVTNNGSLAFKHANDITFDGVISGSGSVVQAGNNVTTLTRSNTYSGGTLISAGTLAGSAASFGSGPIQNNAALNIDQPVDASFANAINGPGSFAKFGAGALNLTGVSGLTGPTTVAGGLLAVNGSLANSAVQVLADGTLGGNGVVGSTVIRAGGKITPGNSIGTLTINGNFTQAAGSTYRVEVNPGSTASDLVKVNGTATLENNPFLYVVKVSPGEYSLNSRYTVLTATNGVTGTYALTGETAGAFYSLVDSYDANNVYLTPVQMRTFPSAALTRNEIATSFALQSLPDGNALKDAVGLLANDIEARDAFNKLSGELHASAKTQMIEDSRFAREAATDRTRQALCAVGGTDSRIGTQPGGAGATPFADSECNPSRPVVWARAFGSWGSTDGDGNAAKLSSSIGGLFAGTDARVSDNWRLGVLAGYSRSTFDVDDRHSSGTSDNYDLGVYGGTQWGDLGLRLGAAYTWHSLDTRRSVVFPGYADQLNGGYDASTAQAFGELGWRIDAGQVQLEPFASLAYVRQSTDGFAERGGLAALTGRSDDTSTTFSTLGLRAASTFAMGGTDWTARGMLGWRHAFSGTVPTSALSFNGSSAFVVAGVPIAKDTAVLELGVDAPIARNALASLSYAGQVGSGRRDNGIRASVSWKF